MLLDATTNSDPGALMMKASTSYCASLPGQYIDRILRCCDVEKYSHPWKMPETVGVLPDGKFPVAGTCVM